MWMIVVGFVAMLLLFAAGACVRVERRQGAGREPLMRPEAGLRAAATLTLLLLIWFVLDCLKGVLDGNGLAAKLIPALLGAPGAAAGTGATGAGVVVVQSTPDTQGTGPAWPTAFVLSTLIAALTAIVLGALGAIWRIVRED